ncbi:MAG: Mce-associated rane protein [Mycobacterium sp.]|nr:Mce-associated rane protein [Mycobacterium sp.]MDT5359958.1 Mce-associated rane protein [Mycobacterium sp.]
MTDEEKTTMVDESKADETAAEKPEIEDAVEDVEDAEDIEAAEDPVDADTSETPAPAARRGIDWSRVLAYGILPGLALVLALTAGFLKYVDNSVRDSDVARVESMQAAKDSTIALLSYQPDKVKTQLNDARNLLTGDFQQSYTSLINDVVIPGAEQKQISAVATVPAAASVSAEPNHAVVLVFVNQTVVVGADAPTDTASSVRVTLDKHGDKWLISEFQPV